MNEKEPEHHDITRTILQVLFIGILIGAGGWILLPFITSIIWAAMIVISTWPLMLKVQSRLRDRRSLATLVMTLSLLMVVFLPLLSAVLSIVGHADEIVGRVRSLTTLSVPSPPEWLGRIPMAGPKLADRWHQYAALNPDELSARLAPYARQAIGWFVAMSGSVAKLFVQFLLTVFISAIFYQRGDEAADWLCRFSRRIAGHHGEQALLLAGRAIRAVAFGVVGTAVIQAILAGLGLAVSGVPAIGILTTLVFIVCLAQLGPMPVLIPTVIWLFWKDQTAWGIALGAWTLFLGAIDNVITPWLMKKGVDLPMLLVFTGVVGGLIVFGIIGLFIGPVVLAVIYTLVNVWLPGNAAEGKIVIEGSDENL